MHWLHNLTHRFFKILAPPTLALFPPCQNTSLTSVRTCCYCRVSISRSSLILISPYAMFSPAEIQVLQPTYLYFYFILLDTNVDVSRYILIVDKSILLASNMVRREYSIPDYCILSLLDTAFHLKCYCLFNSTYGSFLYLSKSSSYH